MPGDEEPPDEAGHILVEPMGWRASYRDMEDFISLLSDGRVADPLVRAIEGRGAFGRMATTQV